MLAYSPTQRRFPAISFYRFHCLSFNLNRANNFSRGLETANPIKIIKKLRVTSCKLNSELHPTILKVHISHVLLYRRRQLALLIDTQGESLQVYWQL